MHKSLLSLAVASTIAFTTTDVQSHDTKTPSMKHSSQSLSAVLDKMPEKAKARFDARNPQQTLEFFGIKPGMTVIEALPGHGWYSKILLPYLGKQGKLIGADYSMEMFPKFGFFSQERLDAKKTWVQDWTKDANGWRNENSASVSAFQLGAMPEEVSGTADAVVFIRALHNLARFEHDGGFLTSALKETYKALKPGGIVGVVQHKAPEISKDEWANGSKGYLKKSYLISQMKKAGFEYVDSSDININLKDKPVETDIVWRLPPSLATSRENEELKKEYLAVGESTRMTLTFRKPS